MNSSLTKEEKKIIVGNKAEVYFPAIKLTPLEWLNNLVEEMKKGVKTKK